MNAGCADLNVQLNLFVFESLLGVFFRKTLHATNPPVAIHFKITFLLMTPRVFWWNYPTLEQKITFSQCRKFLRALSSFAPVRRGGQVYTSLREEKRKKE